MKGRDIRKKMKEDEAKGWAVIIAIVIVSIGIVIIKIQIGMIHFHQNMFWVALVLSPLFLLASLVFLIWGIFQKEGNNNWGYYQEPEFFTRGVIFLFAGGLFLLTLVSFFVIMPNQYNHGYSDEALQRLAELEDQLQSLEELQSVLTGEIIWDVQNQVLEETITSLCKDPNYPCESMQQSYKVYKDLKGAKDEADNIVSFLGLIEKD